MSAMQLQMPFMAVYRSMKLEDVVNIITEFERSSCLDDAVYYRAVEKLVLKNITFNTFEKSFVESMLARRFTGRSLSLKQKAVIVHMWFCYRDVEPQSPQGALVCRRDAGYTQIIRSVLLEEEV